MRLARKLCLLTAMALTALALTATTTNAQVPVEVIEEHEAQDEGHCQPLTKDRHHVEGGCHFEVESEHHIPLVAQTVGGPVTISNCNVHIGVRLAENGVGWVTEMAITPEPPPGTTPSCTRTACDEVNSTQIPWPIEITEIFATEWVETTFCLRTIASGPGGAGSQCEIHLPLSSNDNHQYEIGDETTYSCENLPQISIQEVHFVNEIQGPGEPKEDVEIVH